LRLSLLIILIVCLIPLSVYSASITSCNIRAGSCLSGETALIHTSDITNAHSELLTQSSYSNILCCSGSGLTTDTGSAASYSLLFNLYSATNAHASSDNSYTNPVYLGITTSGQQINCYPRSNSCNSGEKCIVTLSGTTNAHVADCNIAANYSNKICCAITTGASSCSDTDFAGTYPTKEYYTQGAVSINGVTSGTDVCNGNDLTEYYCQSPSSLSASSEVYTCPTGYTCNNGACISIVGGTCQFRTPAYWTKYTDGSSPYSNGEIALNNSFVYLVLNATSGCLGESINLTVWHCDQTLTIANSTGIVSCSGNSSFVKQITSPYKTLNEINLVEGWQAIFKNFNNNYNTADAAPEYYFVANSMNSSNAIVSQLLKVNNTNDAVGGYFNHTSCGTINEQCNATLSCSSGYACINCRCVSSGLGTTKISIKTLCKDDGSGKFGTYNETVTTYYANGNPPTSITTSGKRCILGKLAVPFFDWINVLFVVILLAGFYFIDINNKSKK
jgi:hypothetical protein